MIDFLSRPNARWPIVVGIVLIAFSLCVTNIDTQSIWYDEGLSIYYAQGDLGEILSNVSQTDHPPLHPILLHLWIGLVGESEFSVRILSTYLSIIALVLLYQLGKRISIQIGVISALLYAVSPFVIWYSQEARGYTLALALVVATVKTTLSLLPGAGPQPWWRYAIYVLLGAASMYSHFYSGFVLFALNLSYLTLVPRWTLRTQRARRALLYWLGAQIAILALFCPWMPFVASQLRQNATYWHGAVGWRQIVRRTLTAFSVGETLNDGWSTAATVSMSILASLGTVFLLSSSRTRRHVTIVWIWLLVPISAIILINQSRPKFSPRYLMNALPAFLILVSAGMQGLFSLARRLAIAPAGLAAMFVLLLSVGTLGGATTRSLTNHYLDQRLYKPDFRSVANYVGQRATKDDLIVLVGGHSYPAFTYYYRGSTTILPLPDKLLPTTQQPIDLGALQTLNQAIEGKQTLWLVLWQDSLADPTGLIVDELEQTYHRLGVGETFHGLALLAFDISPGPLLAAGAQPQISMIAELGNQVRFLGYDLPVAQAKPGETLYLYLYWQALPGLADDYKVFTQILTADGTIVAQKDRLAGSEGYPTSHWPPGTIVRDRFLLTIQPRAQPGLYRLIVGLYNPGPGMPRLAATGQGARGDHLLVAEIEVLPQ